MFSHRYHRLESDEGDEEHCLEIKGHTSYPWLRTLLVAIVAFATGASISRAAVLNTHPSITELDELCSDHITAYHSPILDDINIKFHLQEFEPAFHKQSAFQGDASSHVDELWNSLGPRYWAASVPPEQAKKAGLAGRIQLPHSDNYIGTPWICHDIHCLNLLRKALWYNYDYYIAEGVDEFSDSPQTLKIHVAHCLESLRHFIMCNADYGMYGFVHVNGSLPMQDFGASRMCRNFEDIRRWAEEHQAFELADYSLSDLMRRPGDIVLPEPL